MTMKKTMLTCRTLDRFEKMIDLDTLSVDEIKEVEHCAYCANMGAKSEEDAWSWFTHLIEEHLGIHLLST